jgi:hypothetical protein
MPKKSKPLPPVVRDYLRGLQAKSAEAIRGTEAARIRAKKAGASVSPEAARVRARAAAAARWGKARP